MVRQLTINVFPLGMQGPAMYTTQGGMHSLDYTTTRAYAIRVHARPHNALHSPSYYKITVVSPSVRPSVRYGGSTEVSRPRVKS